MSCVSLSNLETEVRETGRDLHYWAVAISRHQVVGIGAAGLQPEPTGTKPFIPVALVQGEIDPGVKWGPAWWD